MIRDHIRMLKDEYGIGQTALARLAGTQRKNISRLFTGNDGQPPPRTVLPRLAESILAIKGNEEIGKAAQDLVPAGLTLRRLQSLVAAGFSVQFLYEYTGGGSKSGENVYRKLLPRDGSCSVFVRTAESVRTMYRELENKTPEDFGLRKSSITVSRRRGVDNGWPVPALWDDPGTLGAGGVDAVSREAPADTVDMVKVARVAAGEGLAWRSVTRQERLAVVTSMLSAGCLHQAVIDALHVNSVTYKTLLEDAGLA